jgi:hypothetical protein
MLGSDALYRQVVTYLEERSSSKPPPTQHPVETPVRFTRRRPATNGSRRKR